MSIAMSPNARTAAIYYFITALFILLACFDTYFALPLNVSIQKFYSEVSFKVIKENKCIVFKGHLSAVHMALKSRISKSKAFHKYIFRDFTDIMIMSSTRTSRIRKGSIRTGWFTRYHTPISSKSASHNASTYSWYFLSL